VVTSKRPDALARSGIDPLDARAARVAALDALARRDHASADLRRKLLEKGYDPAMIGAVIERLRADKLVDDRRYVETFIGYHAARGHGPLRVRADLRRIGVPDELAAAGVEAYSDWNERLRQVRQKKFGATLPTLYADKQRQARFLGSRGFTGAQIRMALGFDTDIDSET
jgi:regulatory protein